MTYIIPTQELEHLSEAELRQKYSAILADLARRPRLGGLKPRGPRF